MCAAAPGELRFTDALYRLSDLERISGFRGMKGLSHSVFLTFLLVVATMAAIALALRGFEYYSAPLPQRPFRSDYGVMRPSGYYSHGLGIIGALMIITGVSTYSTRKRVRALWNLGNLSRWLDAHIFLCLLGPILVVYHTTFKAGGIAAIAFWTMLSVAASGIIGRFFYAQIPRNLEGVQLTTREIAAEIERLGIAMQSSELGIAVRESIDRTFASLQRPKGFVQSALTLARLQVIKRETRIRITRMLSGAGVSRSVVRQLKEAALARATLLQKSLLLSRIERIFFYWHAIHLPFSIIMFLTLAAHVTVVILLGYRWIF